ncbi:hypothetical protein ACROYT_G003133 [Oculina patagonica]
MAGWKLTMSVMIAVVIYALLTAVDKHFKCNLPSVVSSLCSSYKAGHVSGPLCSDLCEQNNIHLGKCLSMVPEKKVYDGEWHGRQVIFKANMKWFMEFKERQKQTDSDLVSSFESEVSSWVETLFGDCSHCSTLVSQLLSLGDSNNDQIVTASEARTFVSLLYQEEPFMLMALNESNHSVDFYGYCGGLYVTEKVHTIASNVFGEKSVLAEFSFLPDLFEPVEEMLRNFAGKILEVAFSNVFTFVNDALTHTKYIISSTFFQKHIPSQKEKFDFLHSLLDATLALSSNPYGIIQSCDMHLGNFGINNDSVVKVTDLDLMYPVVFLRTLLEQKECVSDEDCWVGHIEDCHSSCDTSTSTCTSMVQKQDLVNICETQLPFVFGSSSSLEPAGHNTTCLREAIGELVMYCQALPVAYTTEQLRHDILTVKEKLRFLEYNLSAVC